MGFEIRRIKPGFEHPKTGDGQFLSLFPSGKSEFEFREQEAWSRGWAWNYEALHRLDNPKPGWRPLNERERATTYAIDNDPPVSPYFCMPMWSPQEATHFAWYETVSEGSPVSPVFATTEEMARYTHAHANPTRHVSRQQTLEEEIKQANNPRNYAIDYWAWLQVPIPEVSRG
jgi:hypothetical protein